MSDIKTYQYQVKVKMVNSQDWEYGGVYDFVPDLVIVEGNLHVCTDESENGKTLEVYLDGTWNAAMVKILK